MSTDWIETYLGLIFQIYGLSFFVLGGTSVLSISRVYRNHLTAHLSWLAMFGLFHGMHEFIAGERLDNPEPWLAVFSIVLLAGSYIGLSEFGRRLWNMSDRGIHLAALPLYGFVGVGTLIFVVAFSGSAGLELGARYLLGVPGALLTGLALRTQARLVAETPDNLSPVRWLHVTAAAMFSYGALTLFLSPGSAMVLYDWLPTTTDFLFIAGFPVQILRTLCAIVMAIGFTIICRHNHYLTAVTLHRVTDNINGFVYRCLNDKQWTVTFMSEGGESLTGYPAAEFESGERYFVDLIHPDDQSRVWDEIQTAVCGNNEFQLQYRMVDSYGAMHWCYEVGRGVYDTQGTLLYLEGIVRNDDERQQLAAEQRRMQQLVDGSPQGVGWASLDGTPGYLNTALRKLLGVPEDALPGDYKLSDFYDVNTFEKIEQAVLPAVMETGAWSGEVELRTLAGQCVPTLHSVFALRDKQGEVVSFANVVTNLSEIKRAQQALQRERDLANSLLQTAPAIILLLDSHGMIQHVNPFFEQLTGYREEDIAGKEWFATCLPASDQAQIRELFGAAINEQPVRGHVNAIIASDGVEHMIEWHAATLRDPDGIRNGLLSIGIDVSEREQLQTQLLDLNKSLELRVQERTEELSRELQNNRAILDTAVDGFLCADTTGHIRQANKAFCMMLGYDAAELLTMTLSDIEAAESPEDTAAHIEKVLSKGYDRFDTRHRRKDNGLIDVEVSVRLVSIADEQLFYAFVRDIGWRKAAEAALRQARDDARRANDAKGEFLSRMSHELRSPLNAIIGFGQLLQLKGDQPLSLQQEENVVEILDAGRHLHELVSEMLDLASVESGQLEINTESVDLTSLIKQELAAIEEIADRRRIQVSLVASDAFKVLADPLRLHQVLSNLLSNAVKFNRDAGRVEVECRSVAGQQVRVSVRDSGCGLTAEDQVRIFKPFERLESAYEGIDGAGVGLALVKKLIGRMQGSVGVDSVVGEGSTFWFELPSYAELAGDPDSIDPVKPLRGTPGAKYKVLCVEDNPANLRLIQKMIGKRSDIELLCAVNAEDGLELAAKEHPALVLMDINLPGMDGFEALRRMRSDSLTQSIPVIAVTANAMTRDVELGKAAGFQDYLVKPINMHELFETIDRYLELAKELS